MSAALLKTKRERAEKLAADLDAFAAEVEGKGDGASSEDVAKIVAMGGDLKTAIDEVKALEGAEKARGDSAEYLKDLSGPPPDGDLLGQVRSKNGGGEAPNGKSVGAQFVESPEYKEFTGRFARSGIIPEHVSASTSPVVFKDLITGASATSGGAMVVDDRYGPLIDLVPARPFTLRDVITIGQTDSDTIEFVRVTSKTNAAAPTAEATATTGTSGTKPESALALEVVSTTVKTIPHWIPLTRRAAADAGQVRTLVDTFLREGLREAEEDQILTGDGTGENFLGILNTTGILTVAAGAGAPDKIDAVANAIRTVQVTGRRRPTAFIVHPGDWFSTSFLLAKDTTNRYLIGDPGASIEQNARIWGLPVVVTEAITEGTGLVLDARFSVLWDREQASIVVSGDHSDFRIRNLLLVLAEMRSAFGLLDVQSAATVTGL